MQTTLDIGNETSQKPPKKYSVQEYRAQYIRERAKISAIEITERNDIKQFLSNCPPMYHPIEYVAVIALNSGNKITGYQIHKGTVNQAAVYPQEVFRYLLSACAAGFVLAHNHPAGTLNPSKADWTITNRLYSVGKALDCNLLDHVIVAGENIFSLRDDPKWGR